MCKGTHTRARRASTKNRPFWPFLGGSSGVVKDLGIDFFASPPRYPEVDGGLSFRLSSMSASLGGTGFLLF